MNKRIQEEFEKANWDELYPRLLKHSLWKVRMLWFREGSILKAVNPIDLAEDLVNEAIAHVLDGTVKWNPDEKDNILIFLMGVINSKASHLYDKEEHKTTYRFPVRENEDGSIKELEEFVRAADPMEEHSIASPHLSLSPETAVLEGETKDIKATLLEKVKGDSELEEVVLCILEGIIKPREIAKELGIDSKEVYNRQKRLRRIYIDLKRG